MMCWNKRPNIYISIVDLFFLKYRCSYSEIGQFKQQKKQFALICYCADQRLNYIIVWCLFLILIQIGQEGLLQLLKKETMGGKSSKISQLQFKLSDWSIIQSHKQYDILKNNYGLQAQLYHLPYSRTIFKEQIEVYHYRNSSYGYHIKVLGLNKIKQRDSLCGSTKKIDVLTERIMLFSQSRKLNSKQAVIALYHTLKGFKQLKYFFGYFSVNDMKFGFNQQGVLKMWINENFGLNNKSLQLRKQVNQKTMIQQIYQIISEKSNDRLIGPLKTQYQNCRTFQECIDLISNANLVHIQILQSNIIKIYHQYYEEQDITTPSTLF